MTKRPFSDSDLVLFAQSRYGEDLAVNLDGVLTSDPKKEAGFANHLRDSFGEEAVEAGYRAGGTDGNTT